MRTIESSTMCTELSPERVEAAINKLPEYDRRRARRWYHKKYVDEKGVRRAYPYRRGSDSYGMEHPDFAVTPDQREFMYVLNQHGLSFREIEAIMHLVPQQGNDAQRCINKHIEVSANKGKQPIPKAKGYISRTRTLNIVKSYLAKTQTPNAKAVYKKIDMLLPNNSNHAVGV